MAKLLTTPTISNKGSMEERLAPRWDDFNKLNQKLGPRWPSITQTSRGGALGEPDYKDRMRLTGLKFRKPK